ncbi:hypothetical protein E1A91_D02G163900v1 [Gossypium mustelinum]|uniref:Uncharacterized protein n=4 Tax=Gossypium TaxID=3633 RepID=A0A5D2VWT9_GOSMU|nr:hypothetical protein ES319_D02G157900v1 [Gossypium barbadense]TYG79850.1 hypothetical protein ES288_D02G170200v1 [Gossypium darwinii]TYH84088.1 hypothetical protein ES332_D02G174700v1 [Gossypium tomentosum]TYI93863.1 hypothetical protein E1A91_D02G163900v1 [Gossypium mustelinum]TYI93864.1 hypothetical protein E1A91_D02G163900v1 [Gossypium mustelinum]
MTLFLPIQKSFLVIDDGGFNLHRYFFDPIGRASQILPSSCKGVCHFICLSRSKLKRASPSTTKSRKPIFSPNMMA